MRKNILFVALLSMLLIYTTAWAGPLTIPNTFTAGTPAVANEVNENFAAVKAEVDDNNTRINTNVADIATIGNAMPAVKSFTDYINAAVTSTSPSTPEDRTYLTVTPPADGYIILTASGRIGISQTAAANNYVYIFLTTTSEGTSNEYSFHRTDTSSGVASSSWVPLSITATFPVTGSVSTTFYMTAYRDNSGSNTIYAGFGYTTLTAIYVPNLLP